MTRQSQGGRPEPWDQATLAPETEPTLPRLDLQSAPYLLKRTLSPDPHLCTRGSVPAQGLGGALVHRRVDP
jgi:hypothetical protein